MPDISHSVDEVQFTITFRIISPSEYEIIGATIDSPGKGDVKLPEALWETFGITLNDLEDKMDKEVAAEESRARDDADDAKSAWRRYLEEKRRDRELDPPEWGYKE